MPSKNTIDVSKHGFKIMGMIRGMIRGYDSGAWFGVWFAEMQHACDHKFCIRHFWKIWVGFNPQQNPKQPFELGPFCSRRAGCCCGKMAGSYPVNAYAHARHAHARVASHIVPRSWRVAPQMRFQGELFQVDGRAPTNRYTWSYITVSRNKWPKIDGFNWGFLSPYL